MKTATRRPGRPPIHKTPLRRWMEARIPPLTDTSFAEAAGVSVRAIEGWNAGVRCSNAVARLVWATYSTCPLPIVGRRGWVTEAEAD